MSRKKKLDEAKDYKIARKFYSAPKGYVKPTKEEFIKKLLDMARKK